MGSKIFYTEQDIEDLFRTGKHSIFIDDNVVLTDLAYEKAKALGIELIQQFENPPCASIRPYINKPIEKNTSISPSNSINPTAQYLSGIRQKVREAVLAQLDFEVDEAILDSIIGRVMAEIGMQ